MTLNSILCIGNVFGYCYHSVNGCLAQNDLIKPCSLYIAFVTTVKLGYNKLGYNKLPVITNRKLVSLGLILLILGY